MRRRDFIRQTILAAAALRGAAASGSSPVVATAGVGAPMLNIYVDPRHGNDANDGRVPRTAAPGHGPLASLPAARDLLRRMRKARAVPAGGATVYLSLGSHVLTEALQLLPQDSGTPNGPIVFTSASPRRPALITGGRTIRGWRVNAQGHWEVTLPDVAAGKWYFSQLFVNGRRRYRPRFPFDNYYTISGRIPRLAGHVGDDGFGFSGAQFNAAWHNVADVEVLCFLEWFMARMRIAHIDMARHTVRFTGNLGTPAPWAWLARGKRFIIENVREALRAPGEWYLDRQSGLLTYVPLRGESPESSAVVAPFAPQLLKLSGDLTPAAPARNAVEQVIFRHIDFAYTNWNCPPNGYVCYQAESKLSGAIAATGATHCGFDRCAVYSVGEHAIDLGAGCADNTIRRCCLHDLGAGGVKIGAVSQPPNPPLAQRNVVSDVLIASGGRMHAAGMGVWVGIGKNNIIKDNEIRDLYQSGISLGWTWGYAKTAATGNHVVGNYMHLLGQGVTSDMGGVYMLGVSPGTLVEHNVIKNVTCHRYGGWGIYFDEGASDIVVRHNLIAGTQSAGLMMHYGARNMVLQNIFAFGQTHLIKRAQFEKHLQFTAIHNIFLAAHPGSFDFINDARPATAAPAKFFRLDRNLYWNLKGTLLFEGLEFDAWKKKSGEDAHSVVANPRFAAPEKSDFTLPPGSPAFAIGFIPFNWRRAGIQRPTPAQRAVRPQRPAFPTNENASRIVPEDALPGNQ